MGVMLLFIVSVAVGLFLGTRLFLLVTRGELNVKGAVYSKASTPILYWITFACAFVGMTMMIGIALVMGIGLLKGLV